MLLTSIGTTSEGATKSKSQVAAHKASTMPTPKAYVPAEEVSTTSPLLPHIVELQRQVNTHDEDIHVLQWLVMDAIRSLERQEKLQPDNLEAPPTDVS